MGLNYEVGDIVTLKKGHPCGSKDWEILRVGADFRLKCMGCGHQIMVPRKMVEKNTRNLKKQTCENKFIYSPHSLIQPGYWKSQLRQPSLIRTYVLFCFLMIQSCSSSSRFRDSTIDFKA